MDRRESLRALLELFGPADVQEAAYRRKILELLDGSVEPCSRSVFDPGHVTASGFVISPDHRSVLLVHHSKLKRWIQPGGHIEADDPDVVSAQRREIEEETGLADLVWLGILDLDVHEFPARGTEPAHLHFDVRSAFIASTSAVTAGEGTDDVGWFSPDNVLREDRSLARLVAKLRSLIAEGSAELPTAGSHWYPRR